VDTPSAAVDLSRERRSLLVLGILCGATVLAAAGARLLTNPASPSTPFVLGNVSEAHIVEIRDDGGETVVSGEFRSRVDAIGNTELDAALIDRRGRQVIGEVEIELPGPGREGRRPELEVDLMGLAPRATFTIVVDDRTVGTFTTDDRGSVDMEVQEGEVTPRESAR
jgi:hypothetical protein